MNVALGAAFRSATYVCWRNTVQVCNDTVVCTAQVVRTLAAMKTNRTNVPPALNKIKTDTSNAVQQNISSQHTQSGAATQSTDMTPTATCNEAWQVPLNSGNERSAIVHCTDAKLVSPQSAELQEHQTCYTTIYHT